MEHYKSFFETQFYRDARGLAWCAAQRACVDEDFRDMCRCQWLVPSTTAEIPSNEYANRLRGLFTMPQGIMESSTEATQYSWNIAAHRLDDLLAFFQMFAVDHSLCLEITTPEQAHSLRTTVVNMNFYWDEWGPLLRFIASKVSPSTATDVPIPLDRTPDWLWAFDVLDLAFYGQKGVTRTEDNPLRPQQQDAVKYAVDFLCSAPAWRNVEDGAKAP